MKNWIELPKTTRGLSYKYDVEHTLNEEFNKIESVPGLYLNLMPHQQTNVAAMKDLENKRKININGDQILRYNAGIFSDPVGSGKTICILALILKQKIPKIVPDISPLNITDSNSQNYIESTNRYIPTSIIRKKYTNILTPTLIFVGISVLKQWELAISQYTNLKYFVVDNVRNLELLFKKIETRQVNDYDIILVKNGKVSRMPKLPSNIIVESTNKKSTIYIYNAITNYRNICWARVVNDDMDTNGLPYDAGILNAVFTWYVSSTKKYLNMKKHNGEFSETDNTLLYSKYSCGRLYKNHILLYNLNIRSDSTFIEKYNKLCPPKFFSYVFKNPNNTYISLLGALGYEETNQIAEMLNSDAIESAADRVGIKSTNAADIFQKILGDQYKKYRISVKVINFIESLGDHTTRSPAKDIPSGETYGKKELLKFKEPKFNYPNLKALLRDTLEEYKNIKEEIGASIKRVKSNIQDGECPICCLEFSDCIEEEQDIIILKCCGVIICSSCCFDTIFKNRNTLVGICSRCRRDIGIKALIYIKNDFNLDTIVNEEFTEEIIEEVKESKEIVSSKTDALVNIIKNKDIENKKRIEVVIHNLMNGNAVLPEVETKKVLVFSNYNETLNNTKKRLEEEKIKFWILGGTNQQIVNTIKEFTDCKDSCALLINSIRHCSGLNLQICTDLVFMHLITETNIESQVAGRGQRLGRNSPLKIHYLLYENEWDFLKRFDRVREL